MVAVYGENPLAVMVILYTPVAIEEKRRAPALSVIVVRCPVEEAVSSVTTAPATTDPDGSVTAPSIVPIAG